MNSPDFSTMTAAELTAFIDELSKPENAGPVRARPLREAKAALADRIREERDAALAVVEQPKGPRTAPPTDDDGGTVPLFALD